MAAKRTALRTIVTVVTFALAAVSFAGCATIDQARNDRSALAHSVEGVDGVLDAWASPRVREDTEKDQVGKTLELDVLLDSTRTRDEVVQTVRGVVAAIEASPIDDPEYFLSLYIVRDDDTLPQVSAIFRSTLIASPEFDGQLSFWIDSLWAADYERVTLTGSPGSRTVYLDGWLGDPTGIPDPDAASRDLVDAWNAAGQNTTLTTSVDDHVFTPGFVK